MKKSISILLLTSLLLQSCVVYHSNAVSLKEATESGEVKIVIDSAEYTYNNIERIDNEYYGLEKEEKHINKYLLDSANVTAVYLKDMKKSKRKSIGLTIGVGFGLGVLIVLGIAARDLGWGKTP
jgi:hypothetical protein